MVKWLTDKLIERRLNERKIKVDPYDLTEAATYMRVLNTLRENKIMVSTHDDGIYIRLAGNKHDGMINSDIFAKVIEFNKKPIEK